MNHKFFRNTKLPVPKFILFMQAAFNQGRGSLVARVFLGRFFSSETHEICKNVGPEL